PGRAWLRDLEPALDRGRGVPGGRRPLPPVERCPLARARPARRSRSLGRLDARVVDEFAAAGLQLRDPAGRAEPAAAVGPETPGRSRLEIRMTTAGTVDAAPGWVLPDRGRVGIVGFIVAESAVFAIFVAAYVYNVGKSLVGPTPAQVLDLPVVVSVLLWSSSVTIHVAVRALRGGRVQTFTLWW